MTGARAICRLEPVSHWLLGSVIEAVFIAKRRKLDTAVELSQLGCTVHTLCFVEECNWTLSGTRSASCIECRHSKLELH